MTGLLLVEFRDWHLLCVSDNRHACFRPIYDDIVNVFKVIFFHAFLTFSGILIGDIYASFFLILI